MKHIDIDHDDYVIVIRAREEGPRPITTLHQVFDLTKYAGNADNWANAASERIRQVLRGVAVLAVALILVAPSFAQERPKRRGFWGKFYRVSQALLIGANAADAASSWGRPELNPILAGPNGRFGARGVTIKAAIGAGWFVTEELVTRRNPKSKKLYAITNTVAAGVLGGVAVHNWRNRP